MLKKIFFLLYTPLFLYAQGLVTDRPDFTESASIVPQKSFQLESGFAFAKTADVYENSLPNLLIRYGLHDHVEFRFGGTGWSRLKVNNSSNTYLNDLLVQAKLLLTKETAPTDIAVILTSTLPVGDLEVSSIDAEYGFILAGQFDVTSTLGFGFNIGAINGQVENERYITTILSASFAKALTEKHSSYFEIYGEAPENETWAPVFDFGLTTLVNSKSQFDCYFGLGLNKVAPDFIIGVGFSQLF
jgi:hypothetical protein